MEMATAGRLTGRFRWAWVAVIAVCLAAPAAAQARPAITDVQGFYHGADRTASYVLFEVRAREAKRVFLRWPGHGGAFQRVRGGRVGLGFANPAARSFRVRVRACGRKRCGRAKTFRGTFAPMPATDDGSGGGSPDGGGDGDGGLIPPITVPGTPVTPPIGTDEIL